MADVEQADIQALLTQAGELAAQVTGESPAPRPPVRPGPAPAAKLPPLPPEVRRILQLEVPVIVQLAERNMKMQDVLDWNVGSIIEFENRFDAELKLVVSNRAVGLGHAVKVGENFGLRVTRIGTIYDTIQAMGG